MAEEDWVKIETWIIRSRFCADFEVKKNEPDFYKFNKNQGTRVTSNICLCIVRLYLHKNVDASKSIFGIDGSESIES